MENTQTKTNGHTWKSPFLALCPGLPSNSTLLCSQLLARVPPILFPSKLPEKLLCSSTIFLWCLLPQATLLPFYSPISKHGLPNHSPCCCRHQALSFMAARPIWPGFMVREGGSPSHFQRITAKLHSNSPKTLLNPPTGVSTLLQLQKVRLIPYGH